MTSYMETLCDTGRFCKRLSPLFRVLSVVVYYIVGVCYYYATEDWTIIDSLYFVTVSVATIGYGDFHPTSDSGRFFTSFYLIAGLIFVLSAVDELVRYGILKYQSAAMERLFPEFSPKDRAVQKVMLSLSILLVLATSGMMFFIHNEGWTMSEALYWTVGTMMTVGYGDMAVNNWSTRLFSIFFIAVCVVIYATTMYNLREYYRLTEPPVSPTQDRRAFELATRGNSLDAEEAEGYKQGAYLPNGFSALPGMDPLEADLNADSLESGEGGSLHGATLLVDQATPSANSASCPSSGAAGVSVFMRTVQPMPPKNTPSRRNRTKSTSIMPSMINTTSIVTSTSSAVESVRCDKSSPTSSVVYSALHNEILSTVEMNTIIDPTQHLLAVLEQINIHSNFARDLALLRKKYELVAPDSRVLMTKQELLLLCATPTGSSDTGTLSTLLV